MAFLFSGLLQFSVHTPVRFLPLAPFGLIWIATAMAVYPVTAVYLFIRALASAVYGWRGLPEAHISIYLGVGLSIVSVLLIAAGR